MNIGKKTEDYITCDYVLYTVVWCYLTKDSEQEGKIHKFQHEEVLYATDEDASIEERIDVGEDRVERISVHFASGLNFCFNQVKCFDTENSVLMCRSQFCLALWYYK
jgi:hypothetical protein